jgi:phosphohistidine phosphatase
MQLLIIRHAIAVPSGTPGVPDEERPLTAQGKARFRSAARGLARICRRPDALLTSPLLRACQTAAIAARAWGKIAPQECPALASGDFDELAAALAAYPESALVALVGHEPHVSALLARLLDSSRSDPFTFRKGGAAFVELPGPLAEGGALVFYLPPRVLRRLSGGSK